MSLDKAIQHGKEHRKPYRGSKAVDSTCRNHGSCEWCKRNRLHKFIKNEDKNYRRTDMENELGYEVIDLTKTSRDELSDADKHFIEVLETEGMTVTKIFHF